MKTLRESILDADFDVNLNSVALLRTHGKPTNTWLPEDDFGFAVPSKNLELLELLMLSFKANAKEIKPDTIKAVLRNGKSVALEAFSKVYMISKPIPSKRANINSDPFLSIMFAPTFPKEHIAVSVTSLGEPGVLGVPAAQHVKQAYVIPNKEYAEMLKYVLDHNLNTNYTHEAYLETLYKVCDIIDKR